MNLCAWTIVLILLPVIVFGYYPFSQSPSKATPFEFGLFDTISRIAWSISLSYMIFACVHNSGGPINKFLSLSMWQPISRLTYAIYLVHCLVMFTMHQSVKTPPSFSAISGFQDFIVIFMQSIFIAIPLVLAFELPIDAINKLSTGSKKTKIQPTPTTGDTYIYATVLETVSQNIPMDK